ncbi:hypothetical protein O6P43_007275 [Quillaja saponaria]|uniref:Uncharacterized protein n=1 Tax=Quillaja saponaria TaxID=32244 RepID=A0AAD7QB55_QUISA|nr:hypothetical protein O6P43_007275 [Quillaja saponaria]
MVISTTTIASLVKADGRSLRSISFMSKCYKSRNRCRILAVNFTHRCRYFPLNKLLKHRKCNLKCVTFIKIHSSLLHLHRRKIIFNCSRKQVLLFVQPVFDIRSQNAGEKTPFRMKHI